ncbi:MAG: hypothetical protein ACI9QC_000045 [Oceanicoccus sp.]|jgi:hypothetical protein
MDFFLPLLSDHDVEQAKKRVWNRMEARLPDRGVSPFNEVVKVLKKNKPESSKLQRVMMKERLLDQLPTRNTIPFFLNKRFWATATLSVFVAFFITPVFTLTSGVNASAVNLLEVVQGTVMVNGSPVTEMALLQEGDEVMTNAGAMAHIQLMDDTRITMGPRSEIQLEETNEAITVFHETGRVWTQVVNPLSSVTISFYEGEVVVNQKASFDIQIDEDGLQVQVAENIIALAVYGDDYYDGALNQGMKLSSYDEFVVSDVSVSPEEDVWWDFNESYGETYLSALNETYTQDTLAKVSILPDHPLYFIKAWREVIQEVMTFSDGAKQDLIAQHMELRLNEAQILIEQGKVEEAGTALVAYQEAVEKSLELAGDDDVKSQVEEAQKELFAKLDMDEGTQLLETQLGETSELLLSSDSDKNNLRMASASQKLSRVPGLIASADYEQAYYYLEAYKTESQSILMELESVPLEEREVLISALLAQKLQDLQMLRIIVATPGFDETLDVNSQIIQEMSMMVLTLRERALSRLTDFFASTDYDVDMQYEMYAKLKYDAVLTPEITEQFEAVETALADVTVDPRFLTTDGE